MSYNDIALRSAARKAGSKSGLVYDELRSAIIALKLQPGAQIDKNEMCERLGVSRQPVSEALSRLAEERLVTVEPQKGTYVTRIRMSDVVEAAFVREALEVATVRKLASEIDEETLDRLRLLVSYQAAAVAAGDVEEFYLQDVRFHSTLFAKLAFRRVAEAVESARSHTSASAGCSYQRRGEILRQSPNTRLLSKSSRGGMPPVPQRRCALTSPMV